MFLDAVLDALAVVLPVACVGCGGEDRALCSKCARAAVPSVVERRLSDGTPVFSALLYEGVVREVVLGLKERGRTDVAQPLGAALSAAIAGATAALSADPATVITAVPSGPGAFARRGFDPLRVLLRSAGVRPVRLLTMSRPRPGQAQIQQKSLDRASRSANRAGSMVASPECRGRQVVVVDDVLTTGATLTEAIRALRAAGAEVVAAATLAATPRLFGDSAERAGQTRDFPRNRV